VHEYNALLQHAASAVNKQMVKAEFEELRKQLAAFNSSIATACEEMRKQALALNEQVAAVAA
jgi:Zn-dependent M32 family carboxypeptidase